MLTLPLLLACTNGTATVRLDPPAGTDDSDVTSDTADTGAASDTSGDSGETGDTAAPADTASPQDSWPKPCADLYDPDHLVTFDLAIDEAEWSALAQDCANGVQTYHPATFTFNGETVAAHVRLKGNWSWDCGKMQYVISFNEENPEGRFHGLRKVVLDAPWYDRTLLHERVAFPIFRDNGLPYSCVNNARLNVNGVYYGLYANTERIDREYLERHFEDPDGNLYQGGSELKTNEDVADTHRLDLLRAATTADDIAALVDMDEALREWAVEAMLPALDNYWAGVEINYYLYDHPARGFVYLPYDMDITFGDSAWPDGTRFTTEAATFDPIAYEHTSWRKEALFKTVLADPAWCERYVEALRSVRDSWDPEALSAQVAAWNEQIAGAYAEDPHAPYTPRERTVSVAQLRAFFVDRADFIDGWLAEGGHCPARW